jgi:hypothetical protein
MHQKKNRKLMTINSTKLVKCLEASLSRDETVVNEKIMQLDQKIDPKFCTEGCKLDDKDNKFPSIMTMLHMILENKLLFVIALSL